MDWQSVATSLSFETQKLKDKIAVLEAENQALKQVQVETADVAARDIDKCEQALNDIKEYGMNANKDVSQLFGCQEDNIYYNCALIAAQVVLNASNAEDKAKGQQLLLKLINGDYHTSRQDIPSRDLINFEEQPQQPELLPQSEIDLEDEQVYPMEQEVDPIERSQQETPLLTNINSEDTMTEILNVYALSIQKQKQKSKNPLKRFKAFMRGQ